MFSLEKTTFVQEPDFNLVKPMLKSLTIALVISLALSFLLFPCIAEARVNINVTPKGASEYEEPQIIDEGKMPQAVITVEPESASQYEEPQSVDEGTTPHAVVPEPGDEPDDELGDDNWSNNVIEVIDVIRRLITYVALFAPLILLVGLFQGARDDYGKFLREVKSLIRSQKNMRSKRQAIMVFVLLMILFMLSLTIEFVSTAPSPGMFPLHIGMFLWCLLGAVTVSLLLAKSYYKKHLEKVEHQEERHDMSY